MTKSFDPKSTAENTRLHADKAEGANAPSALPDARAANRRFEWCAIATTLAVLVFLIDVHTETDVSFSVLYVLVVIAGSQGWGRGATAAWTSICAALACGGYLLAHGAQPEVQSTMRFAFALVAITTTGTLMWGRFSVQRAARQVKQGRHDLEVIADSMPQVLWGTSAEGHCEFLNARYTELTGVDVTTAIRDQSWAEPVHPQDRAEMYSVWRSAIETQAAEFRAYGRVRHKDGSYRWMHSVGRSIRSPETGKIVRWFGGLLDVDAEFRAHETIRTLNEELSQLVEERTAQLAQTEWRFRTLFDDANIGVLEQDFSVAKRILSDLKQSGVKEIRDYLSSHPETVEACRQGMRLVDANGTLVRMLGYTSREQMIETPPVERDGAVTRLFPKQLEALFEGSKTVNGTSVLVGPEDNEVPVAYAVHLRADGTAFSTLFDISEREKAHESMLGAQQELASANRMATIGALSVSMAHELNQPIWSISMDVATSMRTLAAAEPDYELLKQVLERVKANSKRLGDIVQRTREKVAGQKRPSQATNIVKLALETCTLLGHDAAVRRSILRVTAGDDVPMVAADRVELQQVLVNLVINALDSVMSAPHSKRLVEVVIEPDGADQVKIQVLDNGPGIAEENLKKVFDPFFTTKSDGIGMGLQICRTTVEALGGSLVAANRPEGGAVFEFTLASAV